MSRSEMPRSPGHVFYDRLRSVLIEGGFDAFAEAVCRPFYATRMGAPSVPPGCYFRMHPVGYFEGIASERGLERQRRSRLVKIGAKVVRHGRYVTFQLTEVVGSRDLFRKFLSLIDDLRPAPSPA